MIFKSDHPGSNPEWGLIYYKTVITAQGIPEPSSLQGNTLGARAIHMERAKSDASIEPRWKSRLEHRSQIFPTTTFVAQVSLVGPLLFNMYINDITNGLDHDTTAIKTSADNVFMSRNIQHLISAFNT